MSYLRNLVRSTLLVIGGCEEAKERKPINSIESVTIHAEENGSVAIRSSLCGSLLKPRRSPSVFRTSMNECIIVAGGSTSMVNHLSSIEYLNRRDDATWKASMHTNCSVSEHSCGAFGKVNNTNVIIGGYDGYDCLSGVQVLEEAENGLKVKPLKSDLPRLKNCVALAVGDSSLLLFGGWEDEKRTSNVLRRLNFNEHMTKFEMSMEALLPYPVEGHAVVRHGNNFFVIGGYDGVAVRGSIVLFKLQEGKSEVLDVNLEIPRENHVAAILDERFLIVAGGWDSRSALRSVEVFEVSDEPPYLKKADVIGIPALQVSRIRPGGITLDD